MRIGALVDNAIPDHPAGAERALHETLEWLASKGHDCTVVARRGLFKGNLDGVNVYSPAGHAEVVGLFKQSDVVITQLEATLSAQIEAAASQTPLVFYAHSPSQLEGLGVIPEACALVLHNSNHVAEAGAWWPGESMILHPPVDPERYRVEAKGSAVTLIGLTHRKGVMEMIHAARDLPSVQFLAVQSAYDDQILDQDGFISWEKSPSGAASKGPSAAMPPNVLAGPSVLDIRPVYEATRVLLVLSDYESWGRVAVEAACSGIPSIVYPTPGLLEAMGDAANWVEPGQHRDLVDAIRLMFNDDHWQAHSDDALARATELDRLRVKQLRALERALKRIVAAKPAMSLG